MNLLKVEEWPVDRLVEYARNPRKNDEQVDRMCGAIREFGFRIPVVAKSDGSVVDGHLRLKAARKLGLETVPVALADDLSEAQIKAFRLLANKSANWASWDDDLLKIEMAEIEALGFDLELTGFSADELMELGVWDAGPEPEGKEGRLGSLSDRFGVPPFSVLNAREGWWQDRKRAWLALGIESELGRGEGNSAAPGGGGGIWGAKGAPTEIYGKAKRANAAPGGSAMPAADYSKSRKRGDGRGRAA